LSVKNGFDGSDDVSNRSDAFQRWTRNEGLADGLGHDDVGQSELFSKSDHEEGGFPLRVPSRSVVVVVVEKEKQFGISKVCRSCKTGSSEHQVNKRASNHQIYSGSRFNVITMGQVETDSINRMITVTVSFYKEIFYQPKFVLMRI